MKLKKAIFAIGLTLAVGCSRGSEERYKLITTNTGAQLLYDNQTNISKVIDNGVVGTIEEFIERIESESLQENLRTEKKFSIEYRLRITRSLIKENKQEDIWDMFSDEDKTKFIVNDYEKLPFETRWRLAKDPIGERIKQGWSSFSEDMRTIYDGVKRTNTYKGLDEKKEGVKEDINKREVYHELRNFFGGNNGNN